MPYLKITTSQSVDVKVRQRLLSPVFKVVAAKIRKPL